MVKTSNLVRSLTADWYKDPKIFEKECSEIFWKKWQYVGHVAEIPTTGDYLNISIAGKQVVVTRSEKGLSAFLNVCRHRGATILDDEKGNLENGIMTCSYHGWSYDLEGKLKSAPYLDCQSDCQLSELRLVELQVETFNGLVFVNFDQSPPALSETYQELFDEIDASEFNLEDYRVHSKMNRTGDFNWKVWVEGYQECYHCSLIHPAFGRDFQLEKYEVENRDQFSVHSAPRKTESASGAKDGLWLFIFPNLGLPIYETCFYSKRVNPIDVHTTFLEYTFHINENADEKSVVEFRNFIEEITDQDIAICESVQKNMDSGGFDYGFLHGERENGVAYFQELVRQSVQASD